MFVKVDVMAAICTVARVSVVLRATSIEVNGQDISAAVTSVSIDARAGEEPTVTLTLMPHELDVALDGVQVQTEQDA